jgi:hypothetical protein
MRVSLTVAVMAYVSTAQQPAFTQDTAAHTATHDTFCPPNYYLKQGTGSTRQTTYDEGKYAADHLRNSTKDHNTTNIEHHCKACPSATPLSNGGYAPLASCHAADTTWTTCSHMGCELTQAAQHCRLHHSNRTDPTTTAAIEDSFVSDPQSVLRTGGSNNAVANCANLNQKGQAKVEVSAGNFVTERIRVWHHGHEQEGTDHKCHLTGTRASATRTCECLCSNGGDEAAKYNATGSDMTHSWNGDTGNNFNRVATNREDLRDVENATATTKDKMTSGSKTWSK